MSYITSINTDTKRKELVEKQNKLLADIRKLAGNKKFEFSEAYYNKVHPHIGIGWRPYSIITKKYLYVSCFVQYTNNEDNSEYGAVIKKFPICYQKGSGEFVNKINLEDLFISDLEKILNEMKFYLWWENDVNFPKVRAEYERLHELHLKFARHLSEIDTNECKKRSEMMAKESY